MACGQTGSADGARVCELARREPQGDGMSDRHRRLVLARALVACTALPALVVFWAPPAYAVKGMLIPEQAPQQLDLRTVLPSLPGKNRVRWWEFDWLWTDLTPAQEGAPVRLYFYREETRVARAAAPAIEQTYRDLVEVFAYSPTKRIPLLLYNSHFEFESTQAFFISEQVLGVTSVEDLTMALPYWGENQRFRHVLRHEMVHQFMIQKVNDRAASAGCNPLLLMPLWFIEGLAETESLPALTPEVRAALADRLIAREGKPPGLPDFFDEGPFTFERIYLLGHAQVRFLGERYGADVRQRILSRSAELCGPGSIRGSRELFASFLAQIVGDDISGIDAAWKSWARQAVESSLRAAHGFETLELVDDLGPGEIDSFSLSSDGQVIFYRTTDRETGVTRLFLRDLDDPRSRRLIAEDQAFRLDSLHAYDRRVTALGRDMLVYIGRAGATDVIFVRPYRRVVEDGRVRFELGSTARHDLSDYGTLIEAGHPAIAPDGSLVVSALARENGFLDLYRFERPLHEGTRVTQLTADHYVERELVFGEDGALYFASDRTPSGNFAIFRLASPAVALLRMPEQANAGAPQPRDGATLFFEADASERTQAYRFAAEELVRVTDVPTYFRSPAVDARGRLLGIALIDERQRLVALPQQLWLASPAPSGMTAAEAEEPGEPWTLSEEELTEAQDYSPLANLRLDQAFAAAASGPVVFGTFVFTDLFRTRRLSIAAEILGDYDLYNAAASYVNLDGRLGLGLTAFISTGQQFEAADFDPEDPDDSFLLQRFGAGFLVEYPLGRYHRLTGMIAPQGLRGYNFERPNSEFARRHDDTFLGLELSAGYALDTLRWSLVGPYDGLVFTINVSGTGVAGDVESFGSAWGDLRYFQNFIRGYERFFGSLRFAGGTTFGGAFREEFYLPAAYNLRAFPFDTLEEIGDHYAFGQLEFQFPVGPAFGAFALQGVAAADVGAISFAVEDLYEQRRAAAIVGGNLVFSPLILRVHFARPFDIGGDVFEDRWITYVSISSPLIFGF